MSDSQMEFKLKEQALTKSDFATKTRTMIQARSMKSI